MRFFVTGATGFVGSHFVRCALAAGHEVVGLRRSLEARPRILLDAEPHWLTRTLCEIEARDLRGIDVLVHLAAAGVDPQENSWEALFQVNVFQSIRLWQLAANAGARRLVVAGSCSEYGQSGNQIDFIPTTCPLKPTTAYGASKAAASLAAQWLAYERRKEVAILRLFHVFGEGEALTRFWPSMRAAAYAGHDFPMTAGEQIRDFTPVNHVANALLTAATATHFPAGQAVIENVGAGQVRTLREFAEEWWRRWNASGKLLFGAIPYRDGEVMRYVPEITQSMR